MRADTEPLSKGETKLRQLDKRDMFTRTVGIFILLIACVSSLIATVQLQLLVRQNRYETVEARKVNFKRQDEMQAYLKCIILLKFDADPEALKTREGTEMALDTCAEVK